jgi:predicted 2-oxoglutarate/Fe(II)-dependent dioxygenase YbiX
MFNDWKGEQSFPGNGDRELVDISDDYPDPSLLIGQYVNSLSDRVAAQLIKSVSHGYSIDARLSLYNVNQQYNWHHDGDATHPVNTDWGRIISSITYLNDDFKGGETEFEDQLIVPESGKTVIFPSSFTFPHRGCPVIEGIKKIIVLHIWV